MTNLAFYREQAALQQDLADATSLVQARARSQMAADAWTALAERERRVTALVAARTRALIGEPNENPDRLDADG